MTKPAEATFHIVFVNLLSNNPSNGYFLYLSSRSTPTNAAVLTSSVHQLRRTHSSYKDFYFASIEVLLSLQANLSLAVLSSPIINQECPFATAITSNKSANGYITASNEQRQRAGRTVLETDVHIVNDASCFQSSCHRDAILDLSTLIRCPQAA